MLVGGTAFAASGLLPRLAVGKEAPLPIALWLRLNKRKTASQWREYFTLLVQAGVGAIYPQVYQNRNARYQSAILPVRNPVLETLLPLAQEAGLEVHGWMHTMLCNVPAILREHPEWYAVSASGRRADTQPPYTEHYRFFCPTRPAVCRFLMGIVDELSAMEGLAGVHLDFIRHPDVFLPARFARKRNQPTDRVLPDNDFCYCEVCKQTFSEESGADWKDIGDAKVAALWDQFRLDRMSLLVSVLARRCRRKGKQISAAVFPTPALSRHMVRQAWDTWPLDAAMPMVYHHNYEKPLEWIAETTRVAKVEVAGRFPIYTGLLMSSISNAEAPKALKQASLGGADGIMLFNANTQDLQMLARTLSSRED